MEAADIGAAATRMLAYADLNHDGSISREEYDILVQDVEYLVEGNLVSYWLRQCTAGRGALGP